jgi:hypothetical protein
VVSLVAAKDATLHIKASMKPPETQKHINTWQSSAESALSSQVQDLLPGATQTLFETACLCLQDT